MSSFKSTIWAYDYYLEDGLFKNAFFPDGIDPDTLHDVIMLECGEMQPVFTDPEFMQQMIGVWSQKWQQTFERWVRAISEEYDPLHNYDRHEEVTDTHNYKLTNKGNIEGQRSAFDSSTYQPNEKTINDLENNDSGTMNRKAHMYGNIGVTTSQQMLRDELSISEWNIYEHIKDLFMQEFCIMVY